MIESNNINGFNYYNEKLNKPTAESLRMQQNFRAQLRNNPNKASFQKYALTISNNPKFIWFRNAKVATRSTLKLLEILQVPLVAHLGMKCHYAPQLYKNHLKFAFVRNPWDRVVSGWINKICKKNALKLEEDKLKELQHFDNFVSHLCDSDLIAKDRHFTQQTQLIDLNEINFLGRFENYQDDIKKLFDVLGLRLEQLPHTNKSTNRESYKSYYNNKTRSIVTEIYKKDIQLFGYNFK